MITIKKIRVLMIWHELDVKGKQTAGKFRSNGPFSRTNGHMPNVIVYYLCQISSVQIVTCGLAIAQRPDFWRKSLRSTPTMYRAGP
ncbi:hypothetical protein BRADI_1g38675v3 [Brachypodium distachyon]|uniref:Uncharacterized protein n=1 Tax=Brachypodium distachyon TaxID=15368 RepID=A0A2K2DNG9_BRADI|nr:hypothetical protein BRADI_1g38675v3 [Brachypodium distachyon]